MTEYKLVFGHDRARGRNAKGLLGDQGGVAAMIMVLMMAALLAAVALVVDTSIWARNKAILQGAADSAALSAVVRASAGGSAAQVQTEALGVAAANGLVNGANGVTVTVNNPPATGSNSGNSQAYEVIISQPQTLFFGRLVGLAPTVRARAVAVKSSSDIPCILALDPSTSQSLKVSGSNTLLSAQGCSIAVNSAHSVAASLSGGGDIDTDQAFHVVGNYVATGGSMVSANPIDTGAAVTADPYASLSVPAYSTCDNYGKTGSLSVLNPGVYCGDIEFKNGMLTMNPGVYIIAGGSFKVSNSVLYADQVSVILTKRNGNYGSINISGGSWVVMTPPTSGAMQGVVIYQDRTTATSSSASISGGSNTSITGSIYLPSQVLKYSGGSSTGSGCLQLIALRLEFTGSSNVGITCNSLVVPGMQSGSKKGLVAE